MTTQKKLIRRKQSLLELAEYLQNVFQACKIHRVSRQHFYDIKKAYEEQGLEGLKEKVLFVFIGGETFVVESPSSH